MLFVVTRESLVEGETGSVATDWIFVRMLGLLQTYLRQMLDLAHL